MAFPLTIWSRPHPTPRTERSGSLFCFVFVNFFLFFNEGGGIMAENETETPFSFPLPSLSLSTIYSPLFLVPTLPMCMCANGFRSSSSSPKCASIFIILKQIQFFFLNRCFLLFFFYLPIRIYCPSPKLSFPCKSWITPSFSDDFSKWLCFIISVRVVVLVLTFSFFFFFFLLLLSCRLREREKKNTLHDPTVFPELLYIPM